MTDAAITVLLCYAAVGVYVWLAGDGLGDAASQPPCRTAAEFVAVVLAWPRPVWRALRHWRGR